MLRKSLVILFTVCLWVPSAFAASATLSAIGDWQTVNSDTQKASSLIHIWESKGKYYGKIAKIYGDSGDKPVERCTQCTGDRKNQPVLGIVLIRDMEKVGNGEYANGMILDPRDGKEYHCKMTVVEDGKILKVRGYIGFSLLGKTSTWYRLGAYRLDTQ